MKRDPRNLERHELIGLNISVVESDCPSYANINGIVVDETMKTLSVRTASGVKMLPKKGKIFHFQLNDSKKTVKGDSLLGRPQDRTKMR